MTLRIITLSIMILSKIGLILALSIKYIINVYGEIGWFSSFLFFFGQVPMLDGAMMSVLMLSVIMLIATLMSVNTLSVAMLNVSLMSVNMPSVVMLNNIMQNFALMSVAMLSVIILNVVMLNIVLMSVVAPLASPNIDCVALKCLFQPSDLFSNCRYFSVS